MATIPELIDQHRALLEEAKKDVERANSEHAAAMTLLRGEAEAADRRHREALTDAMTRQLKAEGAIAVLEALNATPEY